MGGGLAVGSCCATLGGSLPPARQLNCAITVQFHAASLLTESTSRPEDGSVKHHQYAQQLCPCSSRVQHTASRAASARFCGPELHASAIIGHADGARTAQGAQRRVCHCSAAKLRSMCGAPSAPSPRVSGIAAGCSGNPKLPPSLCWPPKRPQPLSVIAGACFSPLSHQRASLCFQEHGAAAAGI